jgi:ankyrin repeat protein
MTTQPFLPARPSLESLRKQAKKLARDVGAGNADAIARARVQLPACELPLSQRNAQLVIAREYGFPGWKDLTEEVHKRLGEGIEWAAIQAKHAIRNNDVEQLKQYLHDFPALRTWRDDTGTTLLRVTCAFRDSFEPERERVENRPDCAAVLLEAGSVVDTNVWRHIIFSRARGMLRLFWSKGVLPRSLLVLTALGDLAAVCDCFDASGSLRAELDNGDKTATVSEALLCACRYQHAAIASFLLERSIALDADLGRCIDAGPGRAGFIAALADLHIASPADAASMTPWQLMVMSDVMRLAHDAEPSAFLRNLQAEPWLLDESRVAFQAELLAHFSFRGQRELMERLLALRPAILRCQRPPQSSAILMALDCGHADLIPLLTRVWPLPDDLPHAAGTGDFANVKKWFDASGRPVLGDPRNHHPGNNPAVRSNLHWGPPNAQHVLDTALAWSVINRQLEIAMYLLERGANINTTWSTHEPASILHELVFQGDCEQMQFVIDHGIDMTIRDYRWDATAEGWAIHAKQDMELARFLADAERKQKGGNDG